MRLLFAYVALAWLLFCVCLAAVLRCFGLLVLLLRLFVRPAAVSLPVSCKGFGFECKGLGVECKGLSFDCPGFGFECQGSGFAI